MKQLSMAGLVSLIGAGSLWAVTIPIYINDVIIQPPTTPPQVDAKAFVNKPFDKADILKALSSVLTGAI